MIAGVSSVKGATCCGCRGGRGVVHVAPGVHGRNRGQLELRNRFGALEQYVKDSELEECNVHIDSVQAERLTRESAMKFNVTNVKKPLVSAVKIVGQAIRSS